MSTLTRKKALAKVDVEQAKVLVGCPLGYKDHGWANQGMDVSDVDELIAGKATKKPAIRIKSWVNVCGIYLPDAIES